MSEYYACKWNNDKTIAERRTREVEITCSITQDSNGRWEINMNGSGDFDHHLVEDAAILLKKMAEVKCGGGH